MMTEQTDTIIYNQFDDYIIVDMEEYIKCKRSIIIRIILAIYLIIPTCFIATIFLVVSVVKKRQQMKNYTVRINYQEKTENAEKLTGLEELKNGFGHNYRLWEIYKTTRAEYSKHNYGCEYNYHRWVASFRFDNQNILNLSTDINTLCLSSSGRDIYFMPDKVIIIHGSKIQTKEYSDIKVICKKIQRPEHENVPKDAKVIGKAWKYSNLDGTRDMRFVDNCSCPLCCYGQVIINFNDFVIELNTSNYEQIKFINSAFKKLKAYNKKIEENDCRDIIN